VCASTAEVRSGRAGLCGFAVQRAVIVIATAFDRRSRRDTIAGVDVVLRRHLRPIREATSRSTWRSDRAIDAGRSERHRHCTQTLSSRKRNSIESLRSVADRLGSAYDLLRWHSGTRALGHSGTRALGHSGTRALGHSGTRALPVLGHSGTRALPALPALPALGHCRHWSGLSAPTDRLDERRCAVRAAALASHPTTGRQRLLATAMIVVWPSLVGCGPRVDTSTGGASDGGGTEAAGGASESATSVGTADTEATDTSAVDPCAESDLPPPFCHVAFPVEFGGMIGPRLTNGTRPIVGNAATAELQILVYHVEEGVSETLDVQTPDLRLFPQVPFVFGDVDGDGIEEIILHPSEFDYGGIPILSLEPLRLLTVMPNEPVDMRGRHPLHTLDVDLDGRDEVLAYMHDVRAFEVWSYDGTWTMRGLLDLPGCQARLGVRAHLDDDGNRELILSGGDFCSLHPDDLRQLTVLSGRPGASIPQMVQYPSGVQERSLHVGDFDGDGLSDVIVLGHEHGTRLVSFFQGEPGGTFAPSHVTPLPEREGLRIGGTGFQIVSGDFDGDRISEFIAIAYASDMFGVTESLLGRIRDRAIVFEDLSTDFRSIRATADMNDDGIDDVPGYLQPGDIGGIFLSIGMPAG
jgi:hypothetical protein